MPKTIEKPLPYDSGESFWGVKAFLLACSAALFFTSSSLVLGESFRSIPELPGSDVDRVATGGAAAQDQELYLEILINGKSTGKVYRTVKKGDDFVIDKSFLLKQGVRVSSAASENVAISSLEGTEVEYLAGEGKLNIIVPADWLPEQNLDLSKQRDYVKAEIGTGLLFNYDSYSTHTDQGTSTSLWNEIRFFSPIGIFSTTSVYQDYLSGGNDVSGQNEFIRYDTSWEHSSQDSMIKYQAGDFITHSMSWSNSIRAGGFQVSKDFSLRPDLVTYPLPEFSGSAAVPSTVDLFINGNRSGRTDVNPGPFTLTDIPYINGAGQAVIVTRDALGREVSTSVPFYVTSDLLRDGYTDYSFGIGKIREDYGIKDFSYGSTVGNANFRYGVTRQFTFESHLEAASDLQLYGIGGVYRLGTLGVLNTSYSHSHDGDAGKDGGQYNAGYKYSAGRYHMGVQYTGRDSGFSDLTSYKSDRTLSEQSLQANASVAVDKVGTLGIGYFDITSFEGDRTKLLNFTWSKPLWGNINAFVSANKDLSDEGGWSTMAQISMPVGTAGSASVTANMPESGNASQIVRYSRSVPSDGGFGYQLAYTNNEGGHGYYQADATHRSRYVQLRGGVYGYENGDDTKWLDASGSVVLMDGNAYLANTISDAFAVVDTSGYSDIPVLYENRSIGKTDDSGTVLVPWATGYYDAKYSIDPMNLPSSTEVSTVEQRVAIKSRAGYKVDFGIRKVRSAAVTLHDVQGAPIALGSVATINDATTAPIGWDGVLYAKELQEHNSLYVEKADGGACRASFDMEVVSEEIANIGPLVCH
ncbi:fimbria/pilus outer membrane usher protein [Halomonas elongata]|uniref:fimbria/pilus outer membrane usher protein n=1 Tax=Halomonas elongata TaxID=2746 RepID=UPI00186BB1AF|nr:fimbria/pilus outer membrane usher protein [Halomonas elongata]MBW5798716.1 fimbria/pilus outer membrane usher protein [Halomonas elongata]